MKIVLIIIFTILGIAYIVFSFIQVFKEKKDRKAIKEELKKRNELENNPFNSDESEIQ